ncbi:16S rRNA (uracil(1498)-N(3))-methyltransferase [Cytophagaceae bacterium ABcell3]|nr:16S rRNA (uracil(1498)-N(3))-methyltransferase [Cytophagaceae bacterium ABcell3]
MQIFYLPDFSEGNNILSEEESRHCINVLRHKKDDLIHVTDGKGNLFSALITTAHSKKCAISIKESLPVNNRRDFSIEIALAPVKSADRNEWFVEKCVELGVDKIHFIHCENSERRHLNPARMERIAISAMKQSLNFNLPKISELQKFNNFLASLNDMDIQKFIAWVDKEQRNKHLFNVAEKKGKYLVLIGPEGDFSEKEINLAIECGFTPISLGNSRLRTETAGIATCHILNLVNDI